MKATYLDHMGSDLSVVNAARVSFAKRNEFFTEKDEKLIQYLARGMSSKDFEKIVKSLSETTDEETIKSILWNFRRTPVHEAPFGHCFISVHVKAPIFVARQAVKHEYLRFSEISRRYVDSEPEFYIPYIWRFRGKNIKQGSSNDGIDINELEKFMDENETYTYLDLIDESNQVYKELMNKYNICPELSRIVLPLSLYTEWFWSGSLDAFANMYNLRDDSHAQAEIRDLAKQISNIIEPLFPISWKSLTQPI